jgi:hypothetical protein
MSALERLQRWRDWFPVPYGGGRPWIVRWVLLDANRLAVTGALLTLVYATVMLVGTVYTFEMRRLLTETGSVQTLLNTLLSGIILLVSIVVSINSIVLSYDITSLRNQEERIGGIVEFRQKVSRLSDQHGRATDPASFLDLMAEVIRSRTEALKEVADGADEELAEEIQQYVDEITETASRIDEPGSGGPEFGVIWLGLQIDYGPHMDRSQSIRATYRDEVTDDFEDRLDDLVEAFQLFATGKEYFKTLYYTEEVSQLSRTLLVVSLPAILVTAVTILAIDAQLLPDVWVLGLPPLLSFVATAFTIALVPFIVLTSYTLRLATVARRTAGSGPFSLQQ